MLRFAWIVILSICSSGGVYAIEDYRLSADTIVTEFLQISNASLEINWQDETTATISISANTVSAGGIPVLSSIGIQCVTDYTAQRFQCKDGVITYNTREQTQISTGIGFEYSIDHNWQFQIDASGIEISQFSPLLALLHPALAEFELTGGRLNVSLAARGAAATIEEVTLVSDIKELSLEGNSVLDSVNTKLELNVKHNLDAWSVDAGAELDAGAMYFIPGFELLGDVPGFYIEPGKDTLTVKLAADWDVSAGSLQVRDFSFIHPGLITLNGTTQIELGDELSIPSISLVAKIASLRLTFPVYLQPLLLNTNFSDLEIAGALDLEIEFREKLLEQMYIDFNGVYLDDNNNRFSLANLNGNLSIRNDGETVHSSLQWDGMSLHRLDFGDGLVEFESVGKQVNVTRWEDVDVLDGTLEISNLNMQNFGTPDFELSIDAELSPISMLSFTQAMQWPLMSGTLSGDFNGLKYAHNNLNMNGDINIQVFDGDVTLRNLRITKIFGEYSKLEVDINIDGLDLEQVTDTFTFGRIEGTLDGWVNNLVLENWQPVHFEAGLLTPLDDDKRHRISQKALENLNSLGSGLSGTMSRGAIRFFPHYSYGQIGLSCRLNNGVCELGGVQQTDDGFYLLTQGGLFPPWVVVKGKGRSIKWDQLLEELKQMQQREIQIQ